MAFRADILAGRAVILVSVQDQLDKQLRGIRTKMFNFSNAMNKIGQDLFLFGATGSAAGLFPVKEFIAFQDSLLFVQTKLQATDKEMKSLESTIRDLGRTTSFTSQQVSEGAAVLAQAGLKKDQLTATLLPVLDLARGARIDIDTSARILAKTIKGFGLSFDEADTVASKLIVASRLGPLDVTDIGESVKESLTTFRRLNVDVSDLVGTITLLSNVNLQGTKAGTSLNTAFAQLTQKTEELAAIGVTLDQSDFGNIVDVFRKIKEGVKGLTGLEQIATLQGIFNIRGDRGFGGVLIQDLDELQSVIDQINQATNEARGSAEKLDSRLGGVFRRGLSSFQETLISIGSTTEGPLTKVGENLRLVFTNVSKLAEQNPRFVQTLLFIPPAALIAGAGLLGLSVVLSRLGLLISPLITLNAALFASLYKLTSVNLGGIGALATPLSGKGFSQKIAAENAAVVKAQQKLAKVLVKGREKTVLKAISGVKSAEASRSFLTRPIQAAEIFRKVLDKLLLTIRKFEGSLFRIPALVLPPKVQLGLFDNVVDQLAFDFIDSIEKKKIFAQLPVVKFTPKTQLSLFDGVVDQLALDFEKKSGGGIIPGPALAKFNDAAEKEISKAVGTLLGPKRFRKELQRTSVPKKLLEDRLKKLDIPKELFPRVLSDALSKIPAKSIKAPPGFIQKAFDFTDSKGTAKQLDLLKDVSVAPLDSKKLKKAIQPGLFDDIAAPLKKATQLDLFDGITDKGPKKVSILTKLGKGFEFLFGVVNRETKADVNVFRFLGKFNVLRGIINVTKGIGSAFRGLFVVLNGLRRFVFSGSGILLILEFLILAGPKIRPIAAILDALGAGFRGMFSALKEAGGGVLTGLKLLFGGIKEFATGDTDLGLLQIKEAFQGIADIISTGLTAAWQRFLVETKKGMEFLKAGFASLVGIAEGLGTALSFTAGTLFGSRSADPTKPYEFDTGPIDLLRAFTTAVISSIEALGEYLIRIADVLNKIFAVAGRILYTIATSMLLGSEEDKIAANALLSPKEQRIQYLKEEIRLNKVNLSFAFGIKGTKAYEDIERQNATIAEQERELAKLTGIDSSKFLQRQLSDYKNNFIRINADINAGFDGITSRLAEADAALAASVAAINKQASQKELSKIGKLLTPNFLKSSELFPPFPLEIFPAVAAPGIPPIPLPPEIEQSSRIIKSILGSFSQTQGQKLQVLPNKVEEEQLDQLKGIRQGVDKLNGGELAFE